MQSEQIIEIIKKRYKSVRQFSIEIGVPYTTIKSGLNAGIGCMAVDTVIKMARALDMTVEQLIEADPPQIKGHERVFMETYLKAKHSDQETVKALVGAIDKILGIKE